MFRWTGFMPDRDHLIAERAPPGLAYGRRASANPIHNNAVRPFRLRKQPMTRLHRIVLCLGLLGPSLAIAAETAPPPIVVCYPGGPVNEADANAAIR